jgi:hypothetical protein
VVPHRSFSVGVGSDPWEMASLPLQLGGMEWNGIEWNGVSGCLQERAGGGGA